MKKKLKKQNNPEFGEFIMKVDIEHFSFNNLLHDSKFMKSIVKKTKKQKSDSFHEFNLEEGYYN